MSGYGLFRKRDFIVLGVIVLVFILTLERSHFKFQFSPSWYIDQRRGEVQGTREDIAQTSLRTKPIISDLDGDGQNEVLFISKDGRLNVFLAKSPEDSPISIFQPQVLRYTKVRKSGTIRQVISDIFANILN
jgi:hypothetical protein